MNRLLSIVVTLFILFMVYIWINHLMQEGPQLETNELAEQVDQDVSQNRAARASKVVPQQEPSKPKARVENEPTPAPTPPPPSSNGNQIHLVIAGNFLERSNAENMAAKLSRLGYKDSEVIRFELSEYHTVCAARFEDADEARRYSKRLKDTHSIDSYVRVAN